MACANIRHTCSKWVRAGKSSTTRLYHDLLHACICGHNQTLPACFQPIIPYSSHQRLPSTRRSEQPGCVSHCWWLSLECDTSAEMLVRGNNWPTVPLISTVVSWQRNAEVSVWLWWRGGQTGCLPLKIYPNHHPVHKTRRSS